LITVSGRRAAQWASLAILASTTGAGAQSIPFSGYANGCFGASCQALTTNAFQTATLNGLTYENALFGGTVVGGSASLGAGANALGVRDVNNLGAFYLTSQVAEYTGQPFLLSVHFDVPGLGTLGIPATLAGFVRLGSEVSGVGIDFDNGPRVLPFSRDGVSGALSLAVNDVFVDAPSGAQVFAVPVTGRITIATVPEPTTWSLLTFGLVVGGVLARCRSVTTGSTRATTTA
jgi:hypothetical protein